MPQSVSSVAKQCPTLCYPIDCSLLGFPVYYQLQSLLKLMSIESVMTSNLLILCCPLLLLPSIFPSIRVFSNESDWFQIRKGKEYVKAVYCHLSYLTSIQSTS